ncbi:hypothetical protein BOTBODRAFT_30259 [Botryobasidium botryosum FD-172 SS1]|uniref:Uncharacterized protein n=1 Tax=Botryobasidium botryosum (strain FD-172 SS1) TaxID=930990 RepID=A0A067MMY5_BOTB1|nr:hypothetical protein BOTBODRAFT_30259 [Botryobasidium botryosum FD-172 SS1]
MPSHWRARNVATLSVAFWLFINNVIQGVNSIIWANDVEIKIPVWCDITTKLVIGTAAGLTAAGVCIARHLESVASPRAGISTAADKRRRTIFELIMCIGAPVLAMSLHYVVQGHRFDIADPFGCSPTVYWSWAAIFIVYLPPLVLSFISAIYCSVALRWFMLRRAQFKQVLARTQSGLTTARYLRLMGFAAVQIFWTTTCAIYTLVSNFQNAPLRPWTTWADVHVNWLRIGQFPAILLSPANAPRQLFLWLTMPIAAIIWFLSFGWGEESVADYRRAISFFRRHVLRQSAQEPGLPTHTMPARGAVSPKHVQLSTQFPRAGGELKWDDDISLEFPDTNVSAPLSRRDTHEDKPPMLNDDLTTPLPPL